MNKKNELNKSFRVLSDEEMTAVSGGWHPFPRGIFGRDGKPFIGKDVVRYGVPIAVKVGVGMIPGVGPVLANAAGAAAKAIIDNNMK